MTVGYLGDELSHTYACAKQMYAEGTIFKGYPVIRLVLEAVAAKEIDECIVPLENSIEGTVTECLDTIAALSLYICKETVMPIHQMLIGLPGTHFEDIETVYSHPQALSQSRNFLYKNLPKARHEAVPFTSAGLSKIDGKNTAAIARAAGENTVILSENIEDYKGNETRFVCIASKIRLQGNKVSVMFSAADKPGALYSILEALSRLNLNMTKIESRPSKNRLGQYHFFVDFMLKEENGNAAEVLAQIEKSTDSLQFLGQYNAFINKNK